MKISKVIGPDHLEFSTRDGWTVVFTGTQHERIEANRRPATQDERNRGQWTDVCEYVVGPRLTFVVEKDAEVAAREEAAEARATAADARRRVAEDELEKLKKQYEPQLEELREKLTVEGERLAFHRDEHDKAVEKKRKLEIDIGKIRQAIGDLRMKEILG